MITVPQLSLGQSSKDKQIENEGKKKTNEKELNERGSQNILGEEKDKKRNLRKEIKHFTSSESDTNNSSSVSSLHVPSEDEMEDEVEIRKRFHVVLEEEKFKYGLPQDFVTVCQPLYQKGYSCEGDKRFDFAFGTSFQQH